MEVNLTAVATATITMFVIGAVWYMGIFSKMWGEMFGFDKLSKKEQKEAQAAMGPWMGLQLIMTVVSAYGLAKMIALLPDYSVYTLAGLIWLCFIVPVTFSSAVFGGTEPKWLVRKLSIQMSESLVHLLAAAWVISMIQ